MKKNSNFDIFRFRILVSLLMLISLIFNYTYKIVTNSFYLQDQMDFIHELSFLIISSSSILLALGFYFAGISGIIGISILEGYELRMVIFEIQDMKFHLYCAIVSLITLYLSWMCLKKTVKLGNPFNRFESYENEEISSSRSSRSVMS